MEFKVVSNIFSDDGWFTRLKRLGYHFSWEARAMLQSKNFAVTKGVTYRCVVIKGSEFDHDPSTEEVIAEGKRRGYLTPPSEVAFLTREFLSDEELERGGFWWLAVMHEPIDLSSDEDPQVFVIHRYLTGQGLASWSGSLSTLWFRDGGFVFVL